MNCSEAEAFSVPHILEAFTWLIATVTLNPSATTLIYWCIKTLPIAEIAGAHL
jgi:hypothetical protein